MIMLYINEHTFFVTIGKCTYCLKLNMIDKIIFTYKVILVIRNHMEVYTVANI